MGRPVVLSNGSLMIGLDEMGMVHDFYYPYVGLENLTNARSVHHKIGVWADGVFSWLDDGTWSTIVEFEPDALISVITMRSERLGIQLRTQDFVDSEYNVFFRKITVYNQLDQARDVRIFMHQVFQISRSGRADTALYVPDNHYIMDYKGRCILMIYGQDSHGTAFDQYAIGNYGIEGKEGTFRDAEDGVLSDNAVEHGGVDSVMRIKLPLEAHGKDEISYWITAADSQKDAYRIHQIVKNAGSEARLQSTRAFWKQWLTIAEPGLSKVPKQYYEASRKSLMVIKAHIDRRGSVLASGDSSIFNYGRDYYCYCWPRDASFALWPLVRLGYSAEAKKFIEFSRDILTSGGYLMHKYQPDKAVGSTWHPLIYEHHVELGIQEDETASVLVLISELYSRMGEAEFVQSVYDTLIQPACDFLSDYIDQTTSLPHASYDLWEEVFMTTTYTTYIVVHALNRMVEIAEDLGFPDDATRWRDASTKIQAGMHLLYDEDNKIYRKGIYLKHDDTIEYHNRIDASSMYGVFMFSEQKQDSEKLTNMVRAVEDRLLGSTPSGGVPRYENDPYMLKHPGYTGNPWPVCTLWLAQYYIHSGQQQRGEELVKWVLNHALPSGIIAEQIDCAFGTPLSVTPLVWSHAELLNTVLDLAG